MKSLLKGQLNSVNCERSRLFQQPNTDPPADVFKLSSSQGRITKTYLFQAVISTSQMVDILTVVVLVYMSSVFFPEPKKNVDRSSTLKSSSPPVRTTSFHTNSTSWVRTFPPAAEFSTAEIPTLDLAQRVEIPVKK